jgi:hypothetical protein
MLGFFVHSSFLPLQVRVGIYNSPILFLVLCSLISVTWNQLQSENIEWKLPEVVKV